ncbi:MAG: hypothetical protein KIT31_12680 [Deltaproteobacteria bacterium]|nr:hypothetical protein [Deltaproteobacteria bacterium]
MNKALVTVLMLASSSVAMAKPVTYSASASVSIGYNTNSRPVVVDHRRPAASHTAPVPWQQAPQDHCAPAPVLPPRPLQLFPTNVVSGTKASSYVGTKPFLVKNQNRYGWVEMTEPTRIEVGRELFTFGAADGRFRKIQLVENAGSSFIQQVAIEFVDGGRTQVVKPNLTLLPNQPYTIDLTGDARQIKRIVVYGTTAYGSAYQILGM